MAVDFDNLPDRRQTGSLKWQRYAGEDVLPMWVADMDFLSPAAIRDALRARVEHGVFGYTVPTPSVEQAVIDYLRQRHDLAIDRSWIVWVPGLVPALNASCRAFGTPGDAVMTNTPVYPPFLTAPNWQGRELIAVPLAIDERHERYVFDRDAMEAAITKRTRLFLLCNPHNPVGRVWRHDELRWLLDFCRRHELILVADEIHCDLILDTELRHHTLLGIDPWAHENSLTLMAPSKTFNVPGLACAFVIAPNASLRSRFQRAARGLVSEVNCFGYVGCEAAYRFGEPWRRELLEVLRHNRALIQDFVREQLPAIRMLPPEATYLAWLDVRRLHLNAPVRFFETHGVGLSDGTDFGIPGFVRLNFGCPESMLREALRRMALACRGILSD